MTDAEAKALIESVLREGEQLVWFQPAPAIVGAELWIPSVVLTLCAVLMGALSAAMAISKRQPKWRLWQIAAFAFVFSFAPMAASITFWAQIAGAATTAYAITEERVIIARRDPWRQVESFGPDDVTFIRRIGDMVSIDYGPIYRSNEGFRTHLRGISEPERVELLIIEHVRQTPPPI